jgi:acetyltransferase-like isoleucine patch superfamily enzyme
MNLFERLMHRWRLHLLRRKGIHIPPDCRIEKGARLEVIGGGSISLGNRCQIHSGAMLLTYGGNIVLGNDVSVNPYTILYGHGGLAIGSGVRIAAHSVLIPSNHNFKDPHSPIFIQGETSLGIHVGNDVWLGAGVRVLDGCTIADGCVIAAGAVLTRSTEPFGVYGGVPAKKISSRLK